MYSSCKMLVFKTPVSSKCNYIFTINCLLCIAAHQQGITGRRAPAKKLTFNPMPFVILIYGGHLPKGAHLLYYSSLSCSANLPFPLLFFSVVYLTVILRPRKNKKRTRRGNDNTASGREAAAVSSFIQYSVFSSVSTNRWPITASLR